MFYIPLVLIVMISLNDWSQYQVFDLKAINLSKLTFNNYWLLIRAKSLIRLYITTAGFAFVSAIGGGILTVVSGYALLRMGPFLKAVSIAIIAMATAVPITVIIIPLFIEMHYLALSGLPAVLLKGVMVSGGAVVAWQYFKSVPQGYFDSATIDGANSLQIIWHILIPISKPLFAMMAISNGITFCTDYMWQALNLINPKMQTVVVSMTNTMIGSVFTLLAAGDNGMLRTNIEMAAGVAMLIPMVLIFFAGRKQLMNFKLEGGIKE